MRWEWLGWRCAGRWRKGENSALRKRAHGGCARFVLNRDWGLSAPRSRSIRLAFGGKAVAGGGGGGCVKIGGTLAGERRSGVEERQKGNA